MEPMRKMRKIHLACFLKILTKWDSNKKLEFKKSKKYSIVILKQEN